MQKLDDERPPPGSLDVARIGRPRSEAKPAFPTPKSIPMKIEKVTLVEFDTTKERQRIENVFKGKTKTRMLSILERFERGEFDALAAEVTDWSRDFAEGVHPVIGNTLGAIAERKAAQEHWPEGFGTGLSDHAKQLLDLRGEPVSPAGLPYPKFRMLPAEGFINPNDVQQSHGYALHVLLSLAHGYLKTQEVLQQHAADNPQLHQHLENSAALTAAAKKVRQQLFGD